MPCSASWQSTALDAGGAAQEGLARQYDPASLAESVVSHARWTTQCYREAWASDLPFWKERSALPDVDRFRTEVTLEGQLATQLAATDHLAAGGDAMPEPISAEHLRHQILNPSTQVRLSSGTRLVDTICVVDGKAAVAPALGHPLIPRPVAYLNGVALAPLLEDLRQPAELNAVVLRWTSFLSRRTAMDTMCWLLRHRLVDSRDDAAWSGASESCTDLAVSRLATTPTSK